MTALMLSAGTASAAGVPTPWSDSDIGSPGVAGSATYNNGTFTVSASGSDIWNSADQFHFISQPWTGNVTVTARVVSQTNTDPWAKAGVMIRQSLAAGSPFADTFVTPSQGIAFQSRSTTGVLYNAPGSGQAPYWVKLVRIGTAFTAYMSPDGTTWTQTGSGTLSFTDPVYVGLAVTSHNNSVLGAVVFDNVSVTVNPLPSTTTTLASSVNPASPSQKVTFSAAVTGTTPTGTVTFNDGATTLGTGTLTGGKATFSTTSLTIGSHSVVATYGGDAANGASQSAPFVQHILGPPTATPQSTSGYQNQPLAIYLTGTDPNSQPLTGAAVTQPAHGTLSGTAPNLTYLPATGYTGSDSFTFTVSNGTFTSSPATVSISITPVPVATEPFASSPYMGWSSWSFIEGSPTEAFIEAQALAEHNSLQSHGFVYVNLDDGWQGGYDAYGRLTWNPASFPHGIPGLAAYVHSLGLKFGIYMTPGLNKNVFSANDPILGTSYHAQDIADTTQNGNTRADAWRIDYTKPGASAYVQSYANLLASWGVDFLKMDFVGPGGGGNSADNRADIQAWHTAIQNTGRPIWLELSNSLSETYASTWKAYSNGWRIDGDIEAYGSGNLTNWGNVTSRFYDAPYWTQWSSSGGWNDLDSLEIGNGGRDGLSLDERVSMFTLWAIEAAPLSLGSDLTNLDSTDLSLLSNDEVIAVDQAGHPASPISQATNQQVWFTKNSDGTYTVGLFNLDSASASVTVNWSDLGFSGSASVRDLWSQTNLGSQSSSFTAALNSHASRLLKVTPATNSIVGNGSFETPAVGTSTYRYNPTGGSWTFTGNSGIQSNGSAWGAPNAPDGTQTAFLQGYGSNGTISQSLSFSAAGTYVVSFQAAQRFGQVQPVQVSVDGVAVGSPISPTGTAFAPYNSAPFTISAAGSHTIKLAATDSTGDKTTFIDKVTVISSPLSVANAASATPNPVTGKTTSVSVLGADPGGEPSLTYTWIAAGPAAVTFSPNGTNAAKNAAATFSQAGSYTLTATITNAAGANTASSVTVPVSQALTAVAVTPATVFLDPSGIQQFTATATDQFGSAITPAPAVTWAATGDGTISTAGLFTAGSNAGTASVTAAGGSVSGTATVTVTATDVLALNAGSGAAGSFAADADFSGGTTYATTAAISTQGVTNPAPQTVYQTERYGNFTYTLPNLTPGASYTLRLHFAELYWNAAGQRVFNVAVNGTPVLSNFDIFAAAGGANKAIVKTFTVQADSSGKVTVVFTTVTDNAKLSGLELLQ